MAQFVLRCYHKTPGFKPCPFCLFIMHWGSGSILKQSKISGDAILILITLIPIMKIEQLQELKLKLTQEKDLSKIWLFYMDHFVDYPEFTDLGKPSPNSHLEAVLKRTCQQLFGKTVKISDFFSIFIAEYQFFHGPFQVEGRMGGVIFSRISGLGWLQYLKTCFLMIRFYIHAFQSLRCRQRLIAMNSINEDGSWRCVRDISWSAGLDFKSWMSDRPLQLHPHSRTPSPFKLPPYSRLNSRHGGLWAIAPPKPSNVLRSPFCHSSAAERRSPHFAVDDANVEIVFLVKTAGKTCNQLIDLITKTSGADSNVLRIGCRREKSSGIFVWVMSQMVSVSTRSYWCAKMPRNPAISR